MKQFFKQLKILLWKNFTLRRRQIFRNVIEFLWPLAIFIILVSVRHKKPAENVPQEKRPIYFAPRALPSAGGLMFIQSFFCNYQVNEFYPEPQNLPSFTNSLFSNIAEDFFPLFENQSQLENLMKLSRDLPQLLNDSMQLVRDLRETVLPTADLFGNNSISWMVENLNISFAIAKAMTESSIKLESTFDLFQNIANISLDTTAITKKVKKEICNGTSFSNIIKFQPGVDVIAVQQEMCSKINMVSLEKIGLHIFSRRDEIEKNVPEVRRVSDLIEETMKRYENVQKETENIPQFDEMFEKIGKLLANISNEANQNLTNGQFLQNFICGRKENFKKSNIEQTFNMASLMGNSSKPKPENVPSKGGSADEKCNNIHPANRTDCGWPGISKTSCLNLNCCFDSSIKSAKYCFCKTENKSNCCHKRRMLLDVLSTVSGYSPQMIDFLTEILEGKIYYTPDNNRTRKVISKLSLFVQSLISELDLVKAIAPTINSFYKTGEQFLNTRDLASDATQIRELLEMASVFKDFENIPFFGPQLKRYEKEISDAQSFLSSFMERYGKYLNESYLNSSQRNQTEEMINSFVDAVKQFDGILDCYNLSSFFQGVATEKDLVDIAISEDRKVNFLSSIVFLNLDDNKPLPKKVEYKLRYNPDYVPSTARIRTRYWKAGPGPWGRNSFWRYKYINFGFVFLQDLVERSLIDILSNKEVQEPGVFIQQFPYPCYIKDDFIAWLGNFMPLFMTLAWVYTIAMIVKSVVYEKELRLKEVMKVMGLENTVHWCAWFITSFVMMFLTIVTLILILKAGKIIIYSNPLVLIFVMSVYACASISMAFLISVFFSRANIAAACGGIIYFFTYLLYPLTLWFEEQMGYTAKSLVSLFSTTAFGLSFKYISRWEEQGIGAQWSNLYENPMPTDTFSLGTTVNFLVLDAIIYLFVMWYFEHIMPGQYGIPKRWYFLFTKAYWCPKPKKKIHIASNGYNRGIPDELNSSVTSESFAEMKNKENFHRKFEDAPNNLQPGITIKNLVKVYANKKKAVDKLNLSFYREQISALLGHNGAGKSTTISILTGLFPPTSGEVCVDGKNVENDIIGVRKSLGLCPQHNVLFDQLTVEEHMWFYGQLKGLEDSKVLKQEINKFLDDVGLTKKRKDLSMNLSGGMKRKLSVAMAFIADSKTVILDEPTSGVDPYSRREIWDLILKYKKGRTILLSTHYMDEADLLGDRISIISQGVLQCSGTSLFLKRQFGKGYSLTITKDMEDSTNKFKHEEITKFISSFIPGAKLQDNFETELSYVMPSAARLTGEFSSLFENLEENLNEFGIKSYGISDTTLEEVFIKASNREEMWDYSDQISMTGPAQGRRTTTADDTISLASFASQQGLLPDSSFEGMENLSKDQLLWGPLLWMWQFKAVLIKRFHHARRAKKGFFSQILLPAVFVICAMGVSMIRPPRQVLPSLKLSTDMFGDPNYIVVNNLNQDSYSNKLMKNYLYNSKQKYFLHNNNTKYQGLKETCSCSSGKQTCSAYPPKPPSIVMDNKDVVYDVTGGDINKYLLESTDQYIRRRQGGATFGEILYNLPESMNASSTPNFISNIGTRQNVKVWFNHKSYHALPTFINMMNNAILKTNAKSDHAIIAYNHPIDFNREQLDEQATYQGIADLFTSIFVITALSFVPASFLVYLVQDRISKSKHLQLVSGLNPIVYWLGNYAWDMINYLIPAFCITIIFLAFNQRAYVSAANFPATMTLLLLYGWSMTPLMYPFSFFFDVPSTAYIVLICGNLFVGIIGTIATFILDFFGQDDMELYNINVVLKQVLLLFPNYSFGRGLMDLAGNQLQADIYERLGSSKFANPFKWDIVGRNVFTMIFTGFAYFLITLLIQYRFFIRLLRSKISSPMKEREEDVKKEQEHILSGQNDDDYIMKTKLLSKMYRSRMRNRKTLAVDRLSFGVKEGECFGLLGVNGAGKTSTFKMLTGDTSITFGDAFIKGYSVRTDLNNARQYMGYCPQFDALDELLTGKEMLTYYAQIRGMNHADGEKMANWAIETLGLSQYQDRACGTYSGGNKRKLSTAIALLGSPPLIFLDEPTTGMDPVARRFLWNVVSSLIKSGKSVILTSHSMEECETLCTRLAIMVNGEFQCIGSPQHLRSKFGMGYTLIIRSKTDGVDLVQDFVESNFKNVILKDRHHYMLEYQLPKEDLLLSTVFHKLELLRKTGSIEDYSVTQTTLDQIFVNFARNQVESVSYDQENNIPVHANGEVRMEDWPYGTSVVV